MGKPLLHVISTGRQSIDTLVDINKQIHPFTDYLHIREKNWTTKQIENVVSLMIQEGVPREKIIVNGHPSIAKAYSLAGIHYPEAVPIDVRKQRLLVGSSVHSEPTARERVADGVDYLFFGHIFATKSKEGIMPRGLTALRRMAYAVDCPIIAIGGIHPENVQACLAYQAQGVAVMSGIYEKENPLERVKDYDRALREGI
ncbi:thiamine phosphate synthase [Alteribacillus iranensis]|uniref:Thiazole tautomerase (Transcriptional regulator TenI) n=1 Tax=Alteribacillus iranensis TaxID=930128 RepID=A0A1I2DH45_9BACI|nr:thiamine phosphate synthase [Alteribacillus iranensis]SFE79768.1 thiazole tautomerase (transcriptional regulator TenI) [Alteribacillus iranensis]